MRTAFLRALAPILITAILPVFLHGQRLTTHPASDYHPKWSPDGQTLLFTSQRGGHTGIWLVPAQGGPAVELPTGMEGDHHISWSPDMTEIVFDSNEAHGPPNIWILTVETGEVRRVMPSTDRGPNFHPAWSPDGARIVFASVRTGGPHLWIWDMEGARLTQLTAGAGRSQHPWWSPDGDAVAFDSDRAGNFDIWTVDADGGNLRQVTDDSLDELQPSISPDQRLIAFTRRAPEGDAVWIRSLATGREARLPTPVPCGWPAWSPDGAHMACSARYEEGLDILVVEVSALVADLRR